LNLNEELTLDELKDTVAVDSYSYDVADCQSAECDAFTVSCDQWPAFQSGTASPTATRRPTFDPTPYPTRVPTTYPTTWPTAEPTTNTTEPSECECPDVPLPLEWLGWTPRTALSECQGDCDYDSDCIGDLLCFHDAAPPGCYGAPYQGADYCYDSSSSTSGMTMIAPPDEPVPPEEYLYSWSRTMAGKDMAILVLTAINAVTIVAACCLCARSKRGGKGKYHMVVATEIDTDLEEAPLRR